MANNQKRGARASFVMIPTSIVRDPALRPTPKAVLAALLSHTSKNDPTCFPAQDTIARELGVNRGTVNAAIATLKGHNAIRLVKRERGRGYRYDLSPTIALLSDSSLSLPTVPPENPTEVRASKEGDLLENASPVLENAASDAGGSDTNYISESDTTNYITPASCRYDGLTESDSHS